VQTVAPASSRHFTTRKFIYYGNGKQIWEAFGKGPDALLAARERGWQDSDEHGNRLRRTTGFASLGGATLDNEENYLIKKLFTALGAIQIENQARI